MPNSADFNHFTNAPHDIDIQRSSFNMSHTVKFSADCGQLIPFEVREILPGDTFSVDTTKVVRLQPLVAPIMDELYLDLYWFYVPNRLIWTHFVNMMGENSSTAWSPQVEYEVPQLFISKKSGISKGSILDYMGLPLFPTDSSGNWDPIFYFSALPSRAYALIVDQWFRSEAVQSPVHISLDDTIRHATAHETNTNYVTDIERGGMPFVACKLFDPFTSALPEPQRGNPVTFDLAGFAPVVSRSDMIMDYGDKPEDHNFSDAMKFLFGPSISSQTVGHSSGTVGLEVWSSTGSSVDNSLISGATTSTQFDPAHPPYAFPNNLWADMSQVTTFNVNDLRTAFAIQRYLERSARSGGRYIEMLSAFFHVDSPDARLQRAEYLGGSRLPININSVTQTSATSSQPSPLGNVAGMSVTGDVHSDFTKSFTEHGLLLGLACMRYRHSYSQGAEPFWFRKSQFDFYNPVFANLGEMPVYNKTIYATGTSTDDEVFGYQEAWYDYRYAQNRVCAEMRPNVSNSLAYWHLGDNYNSLPTLSSTWIAEDKTNLDRCLAVTSSVANQYIADILVDIHAARPMPLYSIPGLIDHH